MTQSDKLTGAAMAIYGYCRVSTLRQANEGESLDVQRRQIEGYAHTGWRSMRPWSRRASPARCRWLSERKAGLCSLGCRRATSSLRPSLIACSDAVVRVLSPGGRLVWKRGVGGGACVQAFLECRIARGEGAELVEREDWHIYFAGAGSTDGTGSLSKRIGVRGLPGVA